jgi:hypothetical protein
MPLNSNIKFQKTLALAARASNDHEAWAAELAARRLMERFSIDPLNIPDVSLYDRTEFSGNPLLAKLRQEALAALPAVESTAPTRTKNPFGRIPFNINGFDTLKSGRKSPEKRSRVHITKEMKAEIEDMMRRNLPNREIRMRFPGLSHGQTSGLRNRMSE